MSGVVDALDFGMADDDAGHSFDARRASRPSVIGRQKPRASMYPFPYPPPTFSMVSTFALSQRADQIRGSSALGAVEHDGLHVVVFGV